jgi:hypothetical protein
MVILIMVITVYTLFTLMMVSNYFVVYEAYFVVGEFL